MTKSASQRTINMSGILAETLRIANANFFLILVFILLVNTPVYISRFIFSFLKLTSIYGESTTKVILWGIDFFQTLFGIFTFIGVSFITQESINNKSTTLKSTLTFSLSRFKDVAWTYIVTYLLIIGRLLLLIFPAIIFGITSSFSTIVSALRQKSGNDAISYSEKLVEGQWWKVFGYQTFYALILFGCATIIWNITRNAQKIDFFTNLAYLSIIDVTYNFATIWFVLFFLRIEKSKEIYRVSNMAQEILST